MRDPDQAPHTNLNGATTPLTVVAYRRLLAIIMSGKLRAGAIVQERPLAKVLHISRTPLRDALFQLRGRLINSTEFPPTQKM